MQESERFVIDINNENMSTEMLDMVAAGIANQFVSMYREGTWLVEDSPEQLASAEQFAVALKQIPDFIKGGVIIELAGFVVGLEARVKELEDRLL